MTTSINYKSFKVETDLGLMKNNIDILLVDIIIISESSWMMEIKFSEWKQKCKFHDYYFIN